METLKSNPSEYFKRLSPLKIESRRKSKSPPIDKQALESGRCPLPYGYHIDLDFVRFCKSLEKGSQNDNPTLTRLKKMKKERRRQTKSMEVMLGITPVENGHCNTTLPTKKEKADSPPLLNAAGRKLTPAPSRDKKLTSSPPSPPPRKSSLTHPFLQSPPPPDIINSSNLVASRRSEQAADALKEAMLNFEETLEHSNDTLKRQRKNAHSNVSSIDLLHHTPSSYYGMQKTPKLTATVGRSNSLPRQFSNEYGFARSTHNWNTLPQPHYGSSYHSQNPLISDAMAALEAAQGFPPNHPPDIDTLSTVSGVSGVSTSTLQSIREQMATGLSRLKDLEYEVKKVPSLQLKMNILKEQNRLLMEQVKALKSGTEPPALPPSIDIDGEYSEDELETRLSLLRRRGDRSNIGRRRSPSPLRVNLEDFKSYRRARASSMSEGSDTESVHSYRTHDRSRDRNDTKLHISENSETDKRGRKTASAFTRRTTRDVGVGCKVTTRDVGVAPILTRMRNIGVGTDRWDLAKEQKKEVIAKPCIQCLKRSQKTYENKGVETVASKNDSGRLSMSSMSLESIDPDDPVTDDPKNSFLHKLGKKSPLISRLSEPQLYPPTLTFDNATNTDPIQTRDRKLNTTLYADDIYTKQDLEDMIEEAKMEWEKQFRLRQTVKRPVLRDIGSQTLTAPEPVKTKSYSAGVQCKPTTRDCGINFVQTIEKPKMRHVAVEALLDVKVPVKTRSVSVGTEILETPKRGRTVACGTSDYARFLSRSIGVGEDKIIENTSKLTKNFGCQALPLTRNVFVETTPISLSVSNTAGTPEAERRPFGSTGVNICDKCHDTITSVAKDIVVGSTTPGPIGPPSKIPRLVDQQKTDTPESKPAPPTRPLQETKSLPIPTIKTKSPSPPPRRKDLPPPHREEISSNASSSIPSISGSPKMKRVPYQRQDTYTKNNSGFVNMAFEEMDQSRKSSDPKRSPSPPKRRSPRRTLAKTSTESKSSLPKTIHENSTESPSVKKNDEMWVSSSSSDEETGDESLAISPSHSMRSMTHSIVSTTASLPPLSQSSSSVVIGPDGKTRKKSIPTRNMKAALKVLNDSIGKPSRSGQQLTNAVNIVQKEWFKVSSSKEVNPITVEEYMDAFEEFSKGLLQRVVNMADANGNTAMHYAVSNGNFDVVSVLLDSKVCNINQQNKAGYTASMLVALAPIKNDVHESVVNRLFELGDVNIKASQHGQTALMLAVSHGRLDMVRMLISAGADVNIQDEDGSTALMCAAEHGHLAIVKYLAPLADTDLYLMDNDGSTALTIAVEAGHKDVGVILYKQMNLSRTVSPYSSFRSKSSRSRTPTMSRSAVTPPPRNSAPPSPGRSRRSSGRSSPAPRQSSASLSNLII